MKRCTACAKDLPPAAFGKWKYGPDGLRAQCLECNRAWNRNWAKENPAKVLEKNQRLRAQHPERYRQYQVKYRKLHPEVSGAAQLRYRAAHAARLWANAAVDTAVRAGRLKRPEACSACGQKASRIHGHHHDYSKPLEVQWLCPRCHKLAHLKER